MGADSKRKSDAGSYKSRKKFKQERNIGRLNQDTYEYFSRIADILKGEIDDEEKATLATNTLEQTEGIEVDVCNHTVAASVLERIIPYATWPQIQRIADAMDKEKDRIKANCESWVEESIIKEAGNRIRLAESEEKEACLQYLNNKSEQLLQNFVNEIWNLNTNFAARTCLSVCSGYEAKNNSNAVISKRIVKKFCKKLMKWPEIADSYYHESISGFLQILIYALKAVSEKKCKKFAQFLIDNCFTKNCDEQSSDTISCEYFEDVPWTRLLEAIIDVASSELQEQLYQKIFINHIETLVLSKKGHFPICKLIKSCTNKLMFENIMEKVKSKFSEIIAANNFDVIRALSEACINTGEKQGEFMKNLSTAVGCSGPNKEKYFLLCVISMKTHNEINVDDLSINFHGSLIVQNLLKFKKPQKLVETLLSLNISVLKRILMDPKGCHVTDVFMCSSSVGTKSKDRLLNALKGHYIDLSMDKYGSRSFDVIWAYANTKQRALIISEMSRQMKKTSFGTIIASKIGLEMYIKDKSAWERAYNSSNKTNKFGDK